VFPKATDADFATAQGVMETTFGDTPEGGEWSEQQKWNVFRVLAEEEFWSGKRLISQIKYFLKNHPYPTWKPADIFAVKASRVFGQAWYEEQCFNGKGKQCERWKLPDNPRIFYRIADGQELPPPFERVTEPLKK
jgi:hypothetical protein